MEKEEEFSFNDESILATYEGHTIFSIFLYKLQAYEKILDQLKGRDFEEELNIFSKPSENGFLRATTTWVDNSKLCQNLVLFLALYF